MTKLRARRLTWNDVTIGERVEFWGGRRATPTGQAQSGPWLKQGRYECDWPSWQDYLGDWATVREQALEEWEEERALRLAHYRAEVEKREAGLRKAEAEGEAEHWLAHHRELYENAVERLAEEEARELPAAEVQYQRALEGSLPQD